MSAGENEKNFKERLRKNLKSKLSLKDGTKKNRVFISVDFHFEYNNKLYLVEIDSGNEAKLLAGQYILLNAIWQNKKIEEKTYNIEDCVFLVVHYYKDYNPQRTIVILSKLQNKYGLKLAFKALHEKDVSNWECLLEKL